MAASERATVLIIDDGDERGFAGSLKTSGLNADALTPSDVGMDDVLKADLVLVDYQLNHWPARDNAEFTLQPQDGLALCSLLRRQIHDKARMSPTAFAIRTGHLDHLASPLPPESRQHILAQLNNLEWVFDKQDSTNAVQQIESLAQAVRQLPSRWPTDNSEESKRQLAQLLKADENNADLMDEILKCHPPLYSMQSWSHGLGLLRWLLHRILPYPCFLIDDVHLAARLRIHIGALHQLAKSPQNPFADSQYGGVLSQFMGRRWWRQSVERKLWEGTEGDTLQGESIRNWLNGILGGQVASASTDDFPVICRDKNQRAINDVFPMSECVRIQPDDWPAYADQSWTTIELAKTEPSLQCLVIPDDLRRLGG